METQNRGTPLEERTHKDNDRTHKKHAQPQKAARQTTREIPVLWQLHHGNQK